MREVGIDRAVDRPVDRKMARCDNDSTTRVTVGDPAVVPIPVRDVPDLPFISG